MDRTKIFRLNQPSTGSIKAIALEADTEYTIIFTRQCELRFVNFGLSRLEQIADDTAAAMVYADHFNGDTPAPVIDYQEGSLRDDFDFGGLQMYRTSVLKEAVLEMDQEYSHAGLYDLRLRASRLGAIVHVNEYIYYEIDSDSRDSGEKIFDYVNPSARAVQQEMEKACTAHLKAVGAWLPPVFKNIPPATEEFEYEASVVIPCKNRVRTIGDAIRSALSQEAPFEYNVIVVDDNSTDGTMDVIRSFEDDPRLVVIRQDRSYHAIGGNWNAAIHHPKCGRYALQLDSDDLYSSPDTVRKFVEAFHEQNCAMIVGSYMITDFNLNPLPPGVIDHREWTDDNGRNNALRVNGFGAPRGFYVPLLRRINFPTTKYGEDYAVALRISREYRIGRIYDVLYNCRRWDDNSDHGLDTLRVNSNNLYKDRIRTWELQARKIQNTSR